MTSNFNTHEDVYRSPIWGQAKATFSEGVIFTYPSEIHRQAF